MGLLLVANMAICVETSNSLASSSMSTFVQWLARIRFTTPLPYIKSDAVHGHPRDTD